MHKLFSSEENGREHDRRVLTWKLVFHICVACQQSPCVPAFKYRQGNGSHLLYNSRAASSHTQIPTRSHFPIKKEGKRRIFSRSNSSTAQQLIPLVLLSNLSQFLSSRPTPHLQAYMVSHLCFVEMSVPGPTIPRHRTLQDILSHWRPPCTVTPWIQFLCLLSRTQCRHSTFPRSISWCHVHCHLPCTLEKRISF